MGSACTCTGSIKKYIFGSTDYILKSEQYKNNNIKIPEKNINIIPREDLEKLDSNVKNNNKRYSSVTKIQINKNNSSNKNEDTYKKISIDNNNNSSCNYGSDNEEKKISKDNDKDNISFSNNNNTINNNQSNNNMHKIIQQKMQQKGKFKKAITIYHYNSGENNLEDNNKSKDSSFLNNDSEKVEPVTPNLTVEKEKLAEMAKDKKRKYSHFCKNRLDEQSNANNNVVKTEQNIIPYMYNFSEEMLKEINSLRKDPESFIEYIDDIINNNIIKTNEGVFIKSQIIDEKVILMENYLVIFEEIKTGLKKIINSNIIKNLEEFKYNNELEIELFDSKDYILDQSHLEKSSFSNNEKNNNNNNNNNNQIIKRNKNNINKILDLTDDKIANLILEKRKEIKNKYPESIFKMNIIKDIKINILIQISMEECYNQYNDKKFLKDIIFNPKYKYFAVSWANEINRKFISISCFA